MNSSILISLILQIYMVSSLLLYCPTIEPLQSMNSAINFSSFFFPSISIGYWDCWHITYHIFFDYLRMHPCYLFIIVQAVLALILDFIHAFNCSSRFTSLPYRDWHVWKIDHRIRNWHVEPLQPHYFYCCWKYWINIDWIIIIGFIIIILFTC